MTPLLLQYLCDPKTGEDLKLQNAVRDDRDHIIEGELVSDSGNVYPILNGIPRFTGATEVSVDTVEHFGDQWNQFNYDDYRTLWVEKTVGNTFDTTDYFKGKVCVDCGGGSGMQTKWMSESGAEHVICLELSGAVDGIISHNLKGINNVDIVQCSIDNPPIKQQSIHGLVICHNVIQHTPSVKKTAEALWGLVGENGEFAFNCYTRMEDTWLHRFRFKFYKAVRAVVSKFPMWGIQAYAHFVSFLGMVPLLDTILVKAMLLHRGFIPPQNTWWQNLVLKYKTGVLNTTDYFGSHSYQHHLSFDEIRELAHSLQKDGNKIRNQERFFSRPQPICAALRVFR